VPVVNRLRRMGVEQRAAREQLRTQRAMAAGD